MMKKTEPEKKEGIFESVTGLEPSHKKAQHHLQYQFLKRLGILGAFFFLIIAGGGYLLWLNFFPEKEEEGFFKQGEPTKKKGGGDVVVTPRPMDVYAQPFAPVPPGSAMVFFVILGAGQFPELTEQALEELPKEISFAISPLVPEAPAWVEKVRFKNHEAMLSLGLEPDQYPSNDPGPQTLLTHLPKDENSRRLRWALQQVPRVVGIVHETGSFFTTLDASLRPLIQEVRRLGLFFLDTLTSPYSLVSKVSKEEESPYAVTDFFCGESPFLIEKELQKIEDLARQKGHVIAVASLSPSLLKNLVAWCATLKEKNLTLLPMTALFKMRILPDATGFDATKTSS